MIARAAMRDDAMLRQMPWWWRQREHVFAAYARPWCALRRADETHYLRGYEFNMSADCYRRRVYYEFGAREEFTIYVQSWWCRWLILFAGMLRIDAILWWRVDEAERLMSDENYYAMRVTLRARRVESKDIHERWYMMRKTHESYRLIRICRRVNIKIHERHVKMMLVALIWQRACWLLSAV